MRTLQTVAIDIQQHNAALAELLTCTPPQNVTCCTKRDPACSIRHASPQRDSQDPCQHAQELTSHLKPVGSHGCPPIAGRGIPLHLQGISLALGTARSRRRPGRPWPGCQGQGFREGAPAHAVLGPHPHLVGAAGMQVGHAALADLPLQAADRLSGQHPKFKVWQWSLCRQPMRPMPVQIWPVPHSFCQSPSSADADRSCPASQAQQVSSPSRSSSSLLPGHRHQHWP